MAAHGIQMVRVPLAEHVVRAAIGGVIVVVRPRVEREFFQLGQVELRFFEQFRIRGGKDAERLNDERLKPPGRDADAAQVNRHRAEPLVVVKLAGPPRF